MKSYLLKRLLFFFPTLIVITLMAFYLGKMAPGDPVSAMIGEQDQDRINNDFVYRMKKNELGLDKPLFYFSIVSFSESDTLYGLLRPKYQELASFLTKKYGNWQSVQNFLIEYQSLKSFIDKSNFTNAKSMVEQLFVCRNEQDFEQYFNRLHLELSSAGDKILFQLQKFHKSYNNLRKNSSVWKNYVPVIHWHGLDNQYHIWLMKFLLLDFGISYTDHRPIKDKIAEAALWTFAVTSVSIVISYLSGIALGVFSAIHNGTAKEKLLTSFILVIYSLPMFWVASMAISFLGGWLKIFPIAGVQSIENHESWSIFSKIADWSWHLFLPILCYSYGSIALISRHMKNSMLETLSQDYVRTAKAKGNSLKNSVWKHAFLNSLFPMVTLFSGVFPALIGGSIVLETIFSLPGMGYLAFTAISSRDYPVIVAVFGLSGFLTILGLLFADFLYLALDPRISNQK